MPCFHQPDSKGRVTVTLEHSAQWQPVLNGVEQDTGQCQRTVSAKSVARFSERIRHSLDYRIAWA
jgi:hypothetical protein